MYESLELYTMLPGRRAFASFTKNVTQISADSEHNIDPSVFQKRMGESIVEFMTTNFRRIAVEYGHVYHARNVKRPWVEGITGFAANRASRDVSGDHRDAQCRLIPGHNRAR